MKDRAEEIIEITAPRIRENKKEKVNERLNETIQFLRLNFWKESIRKSYSNKLWLRFL